MILTSASFRKLWVAAPDWPGDDLRTSIGKFASDFWKEAIVANHQSDFSEPSFEYWKVVSRCNSLLDLAVRQTDLAILTDHLAVRSEQHSRVVNKMLISLVEAQHDVQIVLLGKLTEIVGRWARDPFSGFVYFLRLHVRRSSGDGFTEYDEICVLLCSLGDKRCELFTVLASGLTYWLVVNRC